MNCSNNDVVLDFQHHREDPSSVLARLSEMTRGATVGELLESLGGDSLSLVFDRVSFGDEALHHRLGCS